MGSEQFTFGEFRLDVDRRELSWKGKPVPLKSRAMEVLCALAAARGEIVTKDELMARVWPGVVVEENNLQVHISALRRALGEGKSGETFVVTVPGRGYRLIGVHPTPSNGEDAGSRQALETVDKPSIAVLPFTNMSGDPDQEYFADGISEDLITGLARIRWLFVIARNSSFVYKDRSVDVKQVSRELGVRYVLEGSVRRAASRLRISAQLVDATTGGHHWAERYDREIDDVFAVQDEITRSVAAAIEPNLLAAEGVRALSRSPQDLGAWEFVARAQVHFWRLTRQDHETAVGLLVRAVEAYPDYAPARSLLGFRLVFAAHMGWVDRDYGLNTGHQHCVRAIALDERDPWGHIGLGYWAMMERRTEESIAAFRRALDLNPNSAIAHAYVGRIFAFAGRDREAIEHAEIAIRLSPLDPEMALFVGVISVAHYTAGRFADALRYTTEALRLRPGHQGVQRLHCASLAQTGWLDEARSFLATVRREQPELSVAWIKASVPYQSPYLMELFLEGMRKAGLEED